MRVPGLALVLLALGAVQCGGATGGHLIQMPFEVGGAARDTTQPFEFTTGQGWAVTLTHAQAVLGPIYFNIDAPSTVQFRTGVVILQVTTQFIVDLLDPTLVMVPGGADGQSGEAVSAEIGFYTPANGYNAVIMLPSPLAEDGQQGTAYLEGSASKGGVTVPFAGRVQITSALATTLNPIDQLARNAGVCLTSAPPNCALTFTPTSGPLELRVNPSRWFDQADFCDLVAPPPKPTVTDGGDPPDAGPTDGGGRTDGSASDGGAGGTRPAGVPCAPAAGTVYDWSDTNPFNSAVLGGMKASVGAYQFSLGQP